MSAYEEIVAALDRVPWHLAKEVTPIRPNGHVQWNFFPGHRGFCGESFPLKGVMMVANNFDCLAGWKTYRDDPNHQDKSPTMRRLRMLVALSEIPPEQIWLTNYSLGVMDAREKNGNPTSRYEFPAKIRKALRFERAFEDCVKAMRPRLIVTMGEYASGYIGTDYVGNSTRRPADTRTLYGCKAMAIVHPGAPGVPDIRFKAEADRIRRVYCGLPETPVSV